MVLEQVHRYEAGIAELATAISAGDADAVLDLLLAGLEDVVWLDVGCGRARTLEELADVRDVAVAAARA